MKTANWKREKLGNLVNFKTGKLDSNAAIPNGAYPFFTCSQETFRTNTFAFDTECVLLGGNNANGIFPLKYFSGKFDAYQRTYVITAKNTKQLNQRFLYFALRPKLEMLRSMSTGAATKFLTLTILNSIDFELPPIEEQRRITAILSAYDDLIENNTRRIGILEEMAQRIYEEWFIRFRFPGHEHVPLVASELGLIPQGWEVKSVGETFTVVGGGTPSTAVSEFWDEGTINWYSPTDLTSAKTVFMDSSKDKISPLGLSKSSARLFPPFSVMMTSRATLGVIAINTTEACTNQGFITCIPNTEFQLYILYYWLKQNVELFIGLASGATFKEITKGTFKRILLSVPLPLLSNKFQSIIEPLMKELLCLQRKNQNLRRTRDLLLPKLISGAIDVSGLPEPHELTTA